MKFDVEPSCNPKDNVSDPNYDLVQILNLDHLEIDLDHLCKTNLEMVLCFYWYAVFGMTQR